MKTINKFRDTDLIRPGHQKSILNDESPIKSSKESHRRSPIDSPIEPPNDDKDGDTTTITTTVMESFMNIFKRELRKRKLIPPKDLKLLHMSIPHKAFEDAAIFGALDPDADVSLGLWKHVPGSTISNNLFPKYNDNKGNSFFLYSIKKFQDHHCLHSKPLEPLRNAISMEQSVLLLDKVVTTESMPLPEITTSNIHTIIIGDQHDVPKPPSFNICYPTPSNLLLFGELPMDDERLTLIVSIAHRKNPIVLPAIDDDKVNKVVE